MHIDGANENARKGLLPEENVRVSRGARRAALGVLFLVLIMAGANLLSSYFEYHHFAATQQQQYRDFTAQQQQQNKALDERLCATLDRLAALKPPTGSPVGNPSRAYEQQLAKTLAELKPDIGCAS